MRLNHFKTLVTVMILSGTVVAFQNCAKANFSEDQASTSLKLADDTGVDPTVPVDEDDGVDPVSGKKCDKKDQAVMVECEIMAANAKVVFTKSKLLAVGSNAQSSRVCMSENACLKLVNDYAAARGCNLSMGAAGSDSKTQCAKIFPGSKGTCRNAAKLSDESVASVLAKMAK